MLTSIANSLHHCHNFVYSLNYFKAAKITVGIGLYCGLVAALYVQMVTAKDRINADAPEYFQYTGTLYSLLQGTFIGTRAVVISGLAILILKCVPPRAW